MTIALIPAVRRFKESGLSMVEILVTLTIVAFGLLGLLGLQARALTFQKDSFNRKTAAEMVAELGERMRANHMGFKQGNYISEFAAGDADPASITDCAIVTACTLGDVATRDLAQWRAELRRRIPLSAVYVEPPAGELNFRFLQVTVAWPEPTQTTSGAALQTGVDPLCEDLNTRFGAGLAEFYRCYRTAIFP